jgi:hypothetical protein
MYNAAPHVHQNRNQIPKRYYDSISTILSHDATQLSQRRKPGGISEEQETNGQESRRKCISS